MLVPCPLGSRCETVGKAHLPGSNTLREHTLRAKSQYPGGSASEGHAPTPARAAATTVQDGYDRADEFLDSNDVSADEEGNLALPDGRGLDLEVLPVSRRRSEFTSEDEYLAEAVYQAQQVAAMDDDELYERARDVAADEYGRLITEGIAMSDDYTREANEVAAMFLARGEDYPGSHIIESIGAFPPYEQGAFKSSVARTLVRRRDVRVVDTDLEHVGDEYVSAPRGGTLKDRYEGFVTIESRDGSQAKIRYVHHNDFDMELEDPKVERVVEAAISRMYDSAAAYIPKDGDITGEIDGFERGTADGLVRRETKMEVPLGRRVIEANFDSLDRLRDSARDFFA